MDKIIFNIDSRFRNLTTNTNPEHFVIDLYETHKNIDFFRVTSLEIPNVFFIFTKKRKTNFFKINDTSGWVTIEIPEKYYTVDGLIIDLNSKLAVEFGDGVFTFETDGIGSIKIIKNDSSLFYLDFDNSAQYPSLGYYLGFRKNTYTVTNEIYSESICDVNGENYCFLRVNDYGNFHINPHHGVKALYKITFGDKKGNINFENSSDLINKTYFFRQPSNIKRLEFELLDAYGNRLENRGMDYSLTFEIGQIYDREEYLKKLDSLFDK